jgi:hypothetical protein
MGSGPGSTNNILALALGRMRPERPGRPLHHAVGFPRSLHGHWHHVAVEIGDDPDGAGDDEKERSARARLSNRPSADADAGLHQTVDPFGHPQQRGAAWAVQRELVLAVKQGMA